MSTTGTSPVQKIPLPVVARTLTVLDVTELSASMRRVALGGPELDGFSAGGPTDHAKVYFPPMPDADVPLPELRDGRWVPRDGETPVCRDYTVRVGERAGEPVVELDMAVHPHGPAGRWAASAAPGQRLGLLGPKTTKRPPRDRAWYLFAVDETGLPGLTSWLHHLPSDAVVHAFAEVGGPADEVPLPSRPGVHVTWLHRCDSPAGTTTLLPDAVAAADLPAGDDGDVWVWAAGEAMAVRALRRHVAADRGIDRSCVAMTGYWRHGVAGFDHKSPEATQ